VVQILGGGSPGLIFFLIGAMYDYILKLDINNSWYWIDEKTIHLPIYKLFILTYQGIFRENWFTNFIYFCLLLIFSYIAGHIIASFSSITIDKILIQKGYGYPFETLLTPPEKKKSIFSENFSKCFYKGLIFHSNLLILSLYVFLIIFKIKILWVALIYSLIILLTIIGKGVRDADRHKNNYRFRKYLQEHLPWILKGTLFYYKTLFPLLYFMLSNFLGKLIRTQISFGKDFIRLYKKNFRKIFKLNPNKGMTNQYWLPYCYLVDKNTSLAPLISNWLHLYGFARNLSSVFYLNFLYAWGLLLINIKYLPDLSLKYHYLVILSPLVMIVIHLILLIRYYYLYHSYFSKFIFRAFVYLSTQELHAKNFKKQPELNKGKNRSN